jgi:glycosyltransferase involved in cell wall biosynthesis
VIEPCYGSSHVIYGLETPRYEHRTLATLPLKLLDRRVTFFAFTPFILNMPVPLVHTWNALPINGEFIVSFELELPRYLGGATDTQVRRGLNILNSDRCKRILPLSDFARRYAESRFSQLGLGHLVDKMTVFRGGVPDPLSAGAQMNTRFNRRSFVEKPLSAVVIGTQLFRKGGMYAIKAFERLRAAGADVRLTLIGDFERDSYAFGEALPNADEWRARAHGHDWIRFIGPVSNEDVYKELSAHDLCIYTSLDESLGWLPIEAAMLGVPVIGAAVCAFPELVGHRTTGWLIDLPLREDGRWSGLELEGSAKVAALADADARVVTGIRNCVAALMDDPTLLGQWGTCGRAWATQTYGMTAASQELERIYDDVLRSA